MLTAQTAPLPTALPVAQCRDLSYPINSQTPEQGAYRLPLEPLWEMV